MSDESPFPTLFAGRSRARARVTNDELCYDELPAGARGQLFHLLEIVEGDYTRGHINHWLAPVLKAAAFDLGLSRLGPRDAFFVVFDVVRTGTVNEVLSLLEALMWGIAREEDSSFYSVTAEALEGAVNKVFEDWGFGFRGSGGKFERVDSSLLHDLTISEAQRLLPRVGYSPAERAFREALVLHRTGNEARSIHQATSALESVLKAAVKRRKLKLPSKSNVGALIQRLRENGGLPNVQAEILTRLTSLMESLSGPRNQTPNAGHGGAPGDTAATPHLAGFVLHTIGAALVFIVEEEFLDAADEPSAESKTE